MEINKDYKVNRMTFTYGRVVNLGNYESARFEETIELDFIKEDCTEEDLKNMRKEMMLHLRKQIKTEIKKQLQEEVSA